MEDRATKRARFLANITGLQGKVNLGSQDSGFYNDVLPQWKLQRERPIHRVMNELSMAGHTTKEIATICDVAPNTVTNVLRQPFSREYVMNNLEKTLQQELKAFLEREALPSLQVLAAVRDNDMAKPAERVTAANSILDRFMGKPNQSVTVTEKPVESMDENELAARTNAILNGFGRSNGVPEAAKG